MIYINDDLLSATHGLIVHGCNAQGVMGSGVARAIKDKYPEVFKQYVFDINLGKFGLGRLSLCKVSGGLMVASAITQQYFGRDTNIRYVSYDAIDKVFRHIFELIPHNTHVHIPKIGAGLGNGSWEVISTIIEQAAKDKNFNPDSIFVYSL